MKSAEDKRRYLTAVLKNTGGGVLGDRMIYRILPNVHIHSQYVVKAFTDDRVFREAVARAQIGRTLSSVAFTRGRNGAAAAIIAPLRPSGSKKGRRAIYIYAPKLYDRKGVKKWARASRSG